MSLGRVTVLIADDEPLVRSGLRAILESKDDLVVVGEVEDGADVPAAVGRLRPDLVLMDVRMPRINGIEATRRLLAAAGPHPKVLVVTTFDNDEYVYAALRAGASGFLLKRTPGDEIVQTIRTTMMGDALVFPRAIRTLAETYGPGPDGAAVLAGLTEREQDVLRLVAAGRNNSEIARELFVGVETVKSHVASLLAKLGARDRTQAAITAYETGFVRPERERPQ
ncbi:MAG TPA: response regulator transcription factor [Nocardioides sp.]|nr:response regulator transcription factor [Nocardioides sp.]